MQKKDKEKVLDEVWTNERVKAFINLTVPDNINPDFYVLHAAYKNMRVENFSDFVEFFCEQGKDLQATNDKGQRVLDIIQSHAKSQAYAKVLEKHASH